MTTVADKLRDRLLAGIEERLTKNSFKYRLNELKASEWSPEFEQRMRDNLIMGAFRYGRLCELGKPQYDRVKGMQMHLTMYQEDGNTEHLVDIANIALCEFVEGDHPKKHFRAIDDGEHVEVKQ